MTKKQNLFSFLKTLYFRVINHDIFGLAAQLSYFFLLSLFPLLITLFSIIPYLPVTEEDIIYFIQDFAPGNAIQFIQTNVTDIMSRQNGTILSLGIIGTLWSASNGMNAIVRAMNRAYNVKENRPFLIVRGLSVILTIAMIFIFLIALLLPVFGKHIGIYLFSKFGFTEQFLQIWNTLRWGVSSIILFIVFSFLYLFTPNKKIKCISAFRGAIFSTIGWMAVSIGFSFYVNHFANYTSTYGGLGAIIVLMIWFYLSGVILIMGGEINAILGEDDDRKHC
ncbi:YihY/virulence factor BrkB family protein [Bacillus kwashiorkori]|uniref:YihY/virulence factor BrkB family protein n=1 Tax=Bacillus kwashiorkori TaxID=1522318 RepID=UPI00078645F0|nr:YihY/virulence factor BrkB family protein [Bacillus kwashiorkori]